jgi:hypothetical protein
MKITTEPVLIELKDDIFFKDNYVKHKRDNTLVRVIQSNGGTMFSGLVILQDFENASYSNQSQFFLKEDFTEFKGKITIEI